MVSESAALLFYCLQLCYIIVVVFHRADDDIFCDVGAVYADELHSACVLARDILVCAEIVDEAADDVCRDLFDIGHHSIDCIALEYGYDLVVSLVVVQKSEASDRTGINDNLSN